VIAIFFVIAHKKDKGYKMTFVDVAKRAEKLAIDNSPGILTALGVTGTLTVAYLTGKATFKAADLLWDEQNRLDIQPERHNLEPKEKFQLVWKLYIPAAGTCVFTIVCIVTATRIGNRRAAAVAAAYSISEKAFTEYREKIVEKIGEKKEQSARDELAQERVDRNPVSSNGIIITGSGEVLCYEEFTGRYFMSSMEELRKGQNDTNYTIMNHGDASLTDFYNSIDLPSTSFSDEVGWNTDKLIELRFSTTLSEDGRPCISMGFDVAPIRDYFRIHP
jgi:hypothetical protein